MEDSIFSLDRGTITRWEKLILTAHVDIINDSGGEQGIRDNGGLYNSVCRIVNYANKYSTNPDKIAAFIYLEISRRHHFVDGNKRTAHIVAKLVLAKLGYHLRLKYADAVQYIMCIAEYESDVKEYDVRKWIIEHIELVDEEFVMLINNKYNL